MQAKQDLNWFFVLIPACTPLLKQASLQLKANWIKLDWTFTVNACMHVFYLIVSFSTYSIWEVCQWVEIQPRYRKTEELFAEWRTKDKERNCRETAQWSWKCQGTAWICERRKRSVIICKWTCFDKFVRNTVHLNNPDFKKFSRVLKICKWILRGLVDNRLAFLLSTMLTDLQGFFRIFLGFLRILQRSCKILKLDHSMFLGNPHPPLPQLNIICKEILG